jgi:hypothetical protein
MDEDEVKALSKLTGQDPEKIRTLTADQFRKVKERPSILEGVLNGDIEVLTGGTLRNTYNYKNSPTYKKIEKLQEGDVIPSDLVASILNPLVRYSMEKRGKIPKVDYIPDIPVGTNGITKESLMLYMDRVNDGLINDDMAPYDLDLEARTDTKLSALLGDNMKWDFLHKTDRGSTLKNFANLLNRVAFDNPKAGDEMTIDTSGNLVNVRNLSEDDVKDTVTDKNIKLDIDTQVADAVKRGLSPSAAKSSIEDKLMKSYGKTVSAKTAEGVVKTLQIPNEMKDQLRSSMFKLGYGKNMIFATNPDTGSESFAFRTPLTYSLDGEVISVNSPSGRNVNFDRTLVNKDFRVKAERNKALSRAAGFKGNADKITGALYGVAFE